MKFFMNALVVSLIGLIGCGQPPAFVQKSPGSNALPKSVPVPNPQNEIDDGGTPGEGEYEPPVVDYSGSSSTMSFLSSPDNLYSYFTEASDVIVLQPTIRDFKIAHVDFETYNTGLKTGLAAVDLDSEGKPVFAGVPGQAVTSAESFAQWYRDVVDVNKKKKIAIELVKNGAGIYEYHNTSFFPLDGQLFGNEGNIHNYHFTAEIETQFTYQGGEVFEFIGDDDVFVFINNKLAVDLGGVHGALGGTVNLDAAASALGIQVGNTYTFKMFFAERHTTQSNFKINTSIHLTNNPDYRYQVMVSNPDLLPFTYSIESTLAGLSIDANGLVTLQATNASPGVYPVKISVSDDQGNTIKQSYNLTIVETSLY